MIARFEVRLKFSLHSFIGGCKNTWEIIPYLVLFLFIDRASTYDRRMSMAEIVKLAVVLEITRVQEITEKIRSVSKVYE